MVELELEMEVEVELASSVLLSLPPAAVSSARIWFIIESHSRKRRSRFSRAVRVEGDRFRDCGAGLWFERDLD